MLGSSMLYCYYYSQRRLSSSFRDFFFIPTSLALLINFLFFFLFYKYSTTNLFTPRHQSTTPFKSPSGFSTLHSIRIVVDDYSEWTRSQAFEEGAGQLSETQRAPGPPLSSNGEIENTNDMFHDKYIFLEDSKEMNRSSKIYVYPQRQDDPFANVLLPVESEPAGNYASESYSKKVRMRSRFIIKDRTKADLFFLPFSISRLQHDPRVGVKGVQDFIRDYILNNINQKYPFWNQPITFMLLVSIGRSGQSTRCKIQCHSNCMLIKLFPNWVDCSQGCLSTTNFAKKRKFHLPCFNKEVALLPLARMQDGTHFTRSILKIYREKLAFFAEGVNSPVRVKLLNMWRNDSEIYAIPGRLKTRYANELLGSKFCLQVKGFEVNTARVGDSLHYYGCVPVIIADYYDLPFADVLNWKSFSVVVNTLDIPLRKKVLKGISPKEYFYAAKQCVEGAETLSMAFIPSRL